MQHSTKCALIAGMFFLLVLNISAGNAKAWWDGNWNYKKAINITAGSALTDYQVGINVTYDSDMQADFDDIRFVNGSENAELDYWLDDKVASTWAYFWVEVPSIPSGANENLIYMYYGNAGASSASDGVSTFVLFDDFNDDSFNTTMWNSTIGSPTTTESGGFLNLSGTGAYRNAFWNGVTYGLGYAMDFKALIPLSKGAHRRFESGGFRNAGDTRSAIIIDVSGLTSTQLQLGSNNGSWSATTWTVLNRSLWRGYTVARVNTTHIFAYQNYTDALSKTTNIPSDNLFAEFGLDTYDGFFSVKLDDVRVRKFSYPEPTNAIGDEESTPLEGTLTQLWLNDTEGSIECSYGCTLNATALVNVSGLIVQIYKDEVLIANGTTTTNNITLWEAGNHSIRAYSPGNGTYDSSEVTYYANISMIDSGIELSSSAGWNIQQGVETNISCSAIPSVSLYKSGIGISNPYVAIIPYGSYNISCESNDTENYTNTYTSTMLNVLYNGTGCIDTDSYIYTSTITSPPSAVTLNFSSLVAQYVVNPDLSDVYVPTTNLTVKINNTMKYLIVNATNVTSFTVEFGNAFASNSYTDAAVVNSTATSFSYSQSATYYYTVNILNEINGTSLFPIPDANTSITLNCDNGADMRNVTRGNFIFPTLQQLDSARVTAAYSATSIYYRDLQVISPIQFLNFYMVDAMTYQVVQLLINLQDNTGDFGGSTMYVTKILGGQAVKITELPFDIESKVIIYLMNGGTYTTYITNGVETRGTGNLFVDNVNLVKQIVIYPIIPSLTNEWNVTYNITFNNATGQILFYWYDPFNQTNEVNLSIYNTTDDTLLSTFTSTNSSLITFSYSGNTDSQYRVVMSVDHPMFTNHPFTTSWILSILSGILPILGPAFPTFSPTIMFWTSFIGLTTFGMLFDQRNGALAGIIVAVVGIALIRLGWWSVGSGALAVGTALGIVVLALAVMNKYSERRRVSD